jgi:PAS domain S-box-containing protein
MSEIPDSIRVLLVDGDRDAAERAASRLEREDERFSVATAADAEAGLERLGQDEFDCVVSEYSLPGMDGVAFLERVRGEHTDFPFVLFTDSGSEAVAGDAVSAGVTEYLRKGSGTDEHERLAERVVDAVAAYRSERERGETERWLRELTEATDDILWMFTRDWSELLFINSAYEDISSRSMDTLAEQPQDFLNGVHPEDRERVREAMAALSAGEPVDLEYRVNAEEEYRRWVWVQGQSIRDEAGNVVRVAGFARDVTERKERERELRQSERRYRRLLETSPGPIFIYSLDGEMVYANEAAVEFLAADDRDELLGTSAGAFTHPDSEDDVERRRRRLVEEREPVPAIEERLVDGNGDVKYAIMASAPVTYEGEPAIQTVGTDITEQKARERELARQRERLVALDNLNDVVREVTDAVIEQSTREEIEQVVCDGLAASESYEFAWIGEVDLATGTVVPRAEAGVEGGFEDAPIPVDADGLRDEGPIERAVRTYEMQVCQDARARPSGVELEHASEHDHRSAAAIPVVHDGTLYGVLAVYSGYPDAFGGEEWEVIGQLGEVVGHAIAAVERKRALTSDEVLELEFRIPEYFERGDASVSIDGTVTFDRTIPVGDGAYLQIGTATEDAMPALEALAEDSSVPSVETVTVLDEDDGVIRFEVRQVEPPGVEIIAAHNGYLEGARIEDGDFHATVQLPRGVDVRRITEALQEAYPTMTLLSKRNVTRAENPSRRLRRVFEEELTDRQRATLKAAYFGDYFESPRGVTQEELAETMDVSSPTVIHHLREAERKVMDALFSNGTDLVTSGE